MALDKAIASGKEHRHEYHGSQAFDRTCRPHGSCPWCIGRRTRWRKRLAEVERAELEAMEGTGK